MRLLHTTAERFMVVDGDNGLKPPPYAILSHVWNNKEGAGFPAELQTYQEVCKIQERSENPDLGDPELSSKIRGACTLAREDGYEYIWIDFCCIDRTRGEEVGYAIANMFEWYRCADVCYAFLHDVIPNAKTPLSQSKVYGTDEFTRSEYFKRGWTLPELVAPATVVFLANDWTPFTTKFSSAEKIGKTTGIDPSVLRGEKKLSEVSVATRLSWASQRQTTIVEDQAYALMGLFDVSIPLMYGEGERQAFYRLQRAIVEEIPDSTIIAWSQDNVERLPWEELSKITVHSQTSTAGTEGDKWKDESELTLLAPSHRRFKTHASTLVAENPRELSDLFGFDILPPAFVRISGGYSVTFSTISLDSTPSSYFSLDRFFTWLAGSPALAEHLLALLPCSDGDRFVALLLTRLRPSDQTCYGTSAEYAVGAPFVPPGTRLVTLASTDIMALKARIRTTEITILDRSPRTARFKLDRKPWQSDAPLQVTLAPWCSNLLLNSIQVERMMADQLSAKFDIKHETIITLTVTLYLRLNELVDKNRQELHVNVESVSEDSVQVKQDAHRPTNVSSWNVVRDGVVSRVFRYRFREVDFALRLLVSAKRYHRCSRISQGCYVLGVEVAAPN